MVGAGRKFSIFCSQIAQNWPSEMKKADIWGVVFMKKASFQRKFQKNLKIERVLKLGFWENGTKFGGLLTNGESYNL